MRPLVLVIFILMSIAVQADERDPWENWNRKVFQFNETLDQYVLRPLAVAYRNVTPQGVDDAVSNMFSNLAEPIVIVSDLGQGKFVQAASDSGRFVINSTVGLLGMFDVARHVGLEKHSEDIGQTLAYWGVESGPYVMLPFFGPNTVRDTVGFSLETFALPELNPLTYQTDSSIVIYGSSALKYIDVRGDLVPAEGLISGDKYAFIREIYLQRRHYDVNDGQVEDDFSDDDDFDEDFE